MREVTLQTILKDFDFIADLAKKINIRILIYVHRLLGLR